MWIILSQELALDPIKSLMVAAIVCLSGAVVKIWYDLRGGLAKQLDAHAKRISGLEIENKELKDRCVLLERENQRLITQFLTLSSSHDSSPLPQWIKDETGKVLAVNRAYERLYLIPRGYRISDYLHKMDEDVWPEELAEEFRVNDQHVWRSRETIDVKESVQMGDNTIVKVRIIKFPRYAEGIEEPIGIAGIAVPDDL